MNKTDIGKLAQIVIREKLANQSPAVFIALIFLVLLLVIREIIIKRTIISCFLKASKFYAKKVFY
jgi:hypothetical protein